jgi:phosphocarrier protein
MRHSRRRYVEITNELGLHLRAASRWVEVARQFSSDVRVSWNGRAADGKSILDLVALGAGSGALVEIEVTGPDSEEASEALSALAERRFQEHSPGSSDLPTAPSEVATPVGGRSHRQPPRGR